MEFLSNKNSVIILGGIYKSYLAKTGKNKFIRFSIGSANTTSPSAGTEVEPGHPGQETASTDSGGSMIPSGIRTYIRTTSRQWAIGTGAAATTRISMAARWPARSS